MLRTSTSIWMGRPTRATAMATTRPEHRISARENPTDVPRLRCWQDRSHAIHLAANRAGARQLLAVVDRLAESMRPEEAQLALDATPFPETVNPVSRFGVVRLFQHLRLLRIDDSSLVRYIFAHAVDDQTVEIQLSPEFLPHFQNASRNMANGGGDFAVGLDSLDLSAKQRRRMKSLDKQSSHVWFWGDRNPHGVNTF